MQNRYKKIIFSLAAIFFILLPQVSLAQGLKDAFGSGSPLSDVKTRAGYSDEDIGSVSGRIINTALTMVGIVFLLLMVYAGYLWMTAQGDETKVDKALNIVKGTVIGLVLVMSAYAITVFVTAGLNPASSSSTTASCQDAIPLPGACTAGACSNNADQTACSAAPNACCIWQ